MRPFPISLRTLNQVITVAHEAHVSIAAAVIEFGKCLDVQLTGVILRVTGDGVRVVGRIGLPRSAVLARIDREGMNVHLSPNVGGEETVTIPAVAHRKVVFALMSHEMAVTARANLTNNG